MPRSSARFVLLAVCLLSAADAPRAGDAGNRALVVTAARIYTAPDAKPIEDGVVVIKDGRIAAVGVRGTVKAPAESDSIGGANVIVMAGFQNSHVHFIESQWANAGEIPAAQLAGQLRDMLTRYGFTTVLDTGSPLANTVALRRRIEAGVPGPRILTTGDILFPKGGAPPQAMVQAMNFIPGGMREVDTPERAAEAARDEIADGADAIKVYAVTWFGTNVVMSPAIVKAVVTEAHRRHRLVVAHPSSIVGVKNALDAGVDILAHTAPEGGPWDADLVARMSDHKLALIPTLKLWDFELGRKSVPETARAPFIQAGVDQLRDYAQAGGRILFGTDVGYMTDYDPTKEYELLSLAGLDFAMILASLTTTPAEEFGESKRRGRIARGMDADLVLLSADPARDVRAFTHVKYAIRGGKVIFASESDAQ